MAATVVDAKREFLLRYNTAGEITKFEGVMAGTAAVNKMLVIDYPIKVIDRFIARAMIRIRYGNLGRFSAIVANEGAAIVAALLAAGYDYDEVINLRVNETLNVTDLVDNGQVLPDALHVSRKGGVHKGHRLRDRIDELIRAKIGGDASNKVTFAELLTAGKRVPLHITALDTTTGAITIFSNKTFPTMSVAEAVLASCAVPGYIGYVENKISGSTHKYTSCSTTQSLPIESANTIFATGIAKTGTFATALVAFGFSANSSGVKDLDRAAAAYPDALKRMINLS